MTRKMPLLLIAVLIATSLAFSACSDDENGDSLEEPSPTLAGDPSDPRVGGIAAARQYLQDEGLDGDRGMLSDPLNCEDLPDDADAEFCLINDASVYAPGLVVLYVARPADIDNVWEMNLEQVSRGVWEVREVSEVEGG